MAEKKLCDIVVHLLSTPCVILYCVCPILYNLFSIVSFYATVINMPRDAHYLLIPISEYFLDVTKYSLQFSHVGVH
jgi:hypothetical protein